MAIRDQYKVKLLNGKEYIVSATRQGGNVSLLDDGGGDFMIFTETTKSGVEVRSLHVSKAVVETVEFSNG